MPPTVAAALSQFASTHINTVLQPAEAAGGECAPEAAQERLLGLYRLAVTEVPAYASFLREAAPASGPRSGGNGSGSKDTAEPAGITGSGGGGGGGGTGGDSSLPAAAAADLAHVPYTTKQNYVQAYPLPERCVRGALAPAGFAHCSSGSSGAPTFWARSHFDELAVCARFEQVFRDNFAAQERTTLAVVALPMGAWVGGVFTTLCSWLLAAKGYGITTVTPGNKLPDILTVVRELAPHFEQTMLLGYPPFLKEVVDSGIAQGLDWSRHHLKMVLAGEVFSEEWRDLMVKRCGMADVLRDICSLYGTADAGVIGNETALSVAARRWLAQHPEAARELFGADRLPTLVQYDPFSRFLERHPEDGTLVVSAVATPNTAAPLLRYCIGDAGGILGYQGMLGFLQRRGFALPPGLLPRQLPFAWVFGRSFWTVSLYGANVYVENIMAGLEQPALHHLVTGKFVLYVAEDEREFSKQLALRVELAPGVAGSEPVREEVASSVLDKLLQLNSEYRSYVPSERQRPLLSLHPAGDPAWFPAGAKHKYTL